MPADTCEGIFSSKLWTWISGKFCIDGVVTFDYRATPFPGVDTNAIIFLIKKEKPQDKLKWARCLVPHSQVKKLQIPDNFFLFAVGRTRDVEEPVITKETLRKLEEKGRPTLLFFPNGSRWEDMPEAVKNYLIEGEKRGLPKRPLISTREPWYNMEVRDVPLFLFAYLDCTLLYTLLNPNKMANSEFRPSGRNNLENSFSVFRY